MNSLDVKIGYSVDRDVDSLDFKLEVGLGRPVYFGGVKTRIRARRIKAATDMSFLYLGIFFFFSNKKKLNCCCECVVASLYHVFVLCILGWFKSFLIGTVLNAFDSSSSLSSELNIAFEMRPHPNELKSQLLDVLS